MSSSNPFRRAQPTDRITASVASEAHAPQESLGIYTLTIHSSLLHIEGTQVVTMGQNSLRDPRSAQRKSAYPLLHRHLHCRHRRIRHFPSEEMILPTMTLRSLVCNRNRNR
jgi:hypothetical protein